MPSAVSSSSRAPRASAPLASSSVRSRGSPRRAASMASSASRARSVAVRPSAGASRVSATTPARPRSMRSTVARPARSRPPRSDSSAASRTPSSKAAAASESRPSASRVRPASSAACARSSASGRRAIGVGEAACRVGGAGDGLGPAQLEQHVRSLLRARRLLPGPLQQHHRASGLALRQSARGRAAQHRHHPVAATAAGLEQVARHGLGVRVLVRQHGARPGGAPRRARPRAARSAPPPGRRGARR